MAPRLSGFTRASSLGPITEFMDRQGGSIARVLRDVDLPFALIEQPELLVPLREQFRFLESAARDTGDPHFGARLGQAVSSRKLSAFGAWTCAADTLREAIARAHAGIGVMLQTSTVLTLDERGARVRWSIEFLEPETDGRYHNEMLGVGYMMDVVRGYAGKAWKPDVVLTTCPPGTPRGALEQVMGADVSHEHAVPGIEFDSALLSCRRFDVCERCGGAEVGREPRVPCQDDMLAAVRAVTDLALHEGYPRIDWVAAKLGTTRRSLQRSLAAAGTSFNRFAEQSLSRRAKSLLGEGETSITDIALQLGYADNAHFTRAFKRWTGVTPSTYRGTSG